MSSAFMSRYFGSLGIRSSPGVCRSAFTPTRSALGLHSSRYARAFSTRSAEKKGVLSLLMKVTGGAGLGFGMTAIAATTIYCDPTTPGGTPIQPATSPTTSAPPPPPQELPPSPLSGVSVLELSFGTVAGICAGVFVKKGAKALAFVLGGVFVLMQYLGSTSLIRVDWTKMGGRFENLFYSKDATTGARKAPTVLSLWNWLVNFLTADFPPRASFLAGLALGLRVG